MSAALLGNADGAAAQSHRGRTDLHRAVAFLRETGDELVGAINDPKLGPAARRQRVADILRRGVDIAGVGRFILARYWRRASPAQRDEYLRLFE